MQPLARSSFWMSDAGPCDSKVHFLRLFRSPSGFMKHFKWHSVYLPEHRSKTRIINTKQMYFLSILLIKYLIVIVFHKWYQNQRFSQIHIRSSLEPKWAKVEIQKIILNFINLLFVLFCNDCRRKCTM